MYLCRQDVWYNNSSWKNQPTVKGGHLYCLNLVYGQMISLLEEPFSCLYYTFLPCKSLECSLLWQLWHSTITLSTLYSVPLPPRLWRSTFLSELHRLHLEVSNKALRCLCGLLCTSHIERYLLTPLSVSLYSDKLLHPVILQSFLVIITIFTS